MLSLNSCLGAEESFCICNNGSVQVASSWIQLLAWVHNKTFLCIVCYFYTFVPRVLSVLYLVQLIMFTVALSLAAESPDPRVYTHSLDFLRVSFECVSLLYLMTVLVIDCVLFV